MYQVRDRRACNRAYTVGPRHGSGRKIAISLVNPDELAADSEAVQKRAWRRLNGDLPEADIWTGMLPPPSNIRDLTTRSHLNWPNPIRQAFLDKSRVKSIQQRIYLRDQCPCLRF